MKSDRLDWKRDFFTIVKRNDYYYVINMFGIKIKLSDTFGTVCHPLALCSIADAESLIKVLGIFRSRISYKKLKNINYRYEY